jgi:hypothetical protein
VHVAAIELTERTDDLNSDLRTYLHRCVVALLFPVACVVDLVSLLV